MRILFSSTGGAGHFTPLVAWIELSLRRGPEVLVVGPAKLAETTTRAGYPTRVGESPSSEEVGHTPADALYQQAFCSISSSPGARAYDAHRARGNAHHQALRALGNRLVGILDGCLRHHKNYDEQIAWPTPTAAAA